MATWGTTLTIYSGYWLGSTTPLGWLVDNHGRVSIYPQKEEVDNH